MEGFYWCKKIFKSLNYLHRVEIQLYDNDDNLKYKWKKMFKYIG